MALERRESWQAVYQMNHREELYLVQHRTVKFCQHPAPVCRIYHIKNKVRNALYDYACSINNLISVRHMSFSEIPPMSFIKTTKKYHT